jgi:hypothetical protein
VLGDPKVSAVADTAEGAYWRALTLLPSAPRDAAAAVERLLSAEPPLASIEAEWRLAAVGAAATASLGDTERAAAWRARAERALQRLRTEWKQDAPKYEARPDLQELRRAAGLATPQM